MALASQPAAIAELRARLERMTGHGGSMAAALPFGIEAIDEHLPGGGLRQTRRISSTLQWQSGYTAPRPMLPDCAVEQRQEVFRP